MFFFSYAMVAFILLLHYCVLHYFYALIKTWSCDVMTASCIMWCHEVIKKLKFQVFFLNPKKNYIKFETSLAVILAEITIINSKDNKMTSWRHGGILLVTSWRHGNFFLKKFSTWKRTCIKFETPWTRSSYFFLLLFCNYMFGFKNSPLDSEL